MAAAESSMGDSNEVKSEHDSPISIVGGHESPHSEKKTITTNYFSYIDVKLVLQVILLQKFSRAEIFESQIIVLL